MQSLGYGYGRVPASQSRGRLSCVVVYTIVFVFVCFTVIYAVFFGMAFLIPENVFLLNLSESRYLRQECQMKLRKKKTG